MPTSRPSSPTTPPKHVVPQNRPEYPPPPQQRPSRSYISMFVRWLQLKKYQYEVTFSLYMLTPTERLIFNVIILLLLILLVTAASMYLPDHIAVIYNRIWYYVHGGNETEALKPTGSAAAVLKGAKDSLSRTLGLMSSRTAEAEKSIRRAAGEL